MKYALNPADLDDTNDMDDESSAYIRALIDGNIKAVQAYIDEDPAKINRISASLTDMHPLEVVYRLCDSKKKNDMLALFMLHEPDIRAGGCQSLATLINMGFDQAFTLVENVDPGSCLPLLMGIESAIRFNQSVTSRLLSRYPEIEKWEKRGLLCSLFDPDTPPDESWYEVLARFPKDEDDGLIMKLAVVSPWAGSVLERLLRNGYPANANKDAPLKIACLTERPDLINLLAQHGADPYASCATACETALKFQDPFVMKSLNRAISCDQSRHAASFKGVCTDNNHRSETLLSDLHKAARAGQLGPYLEMLKNLRETKPEAMQTLLNGASLADILAARNEGTILFSSEIWGDNHAAAKETFDYLPPCLKKQVTGSYQEFLQDIDDRKALQLVRSRAKKSKFTIRR